VGKRQTILFGNRAEWRPLALSALDKTDFDILDLELNAKTIELPEIDVILPFEICEYDVLRSSMVASRKSLAPDVAHVHLANDKQIFNEWLQSTPFASCIPLVSAKPVRFPVIRKKAIDEFGASSVIFHKRSEIEDAGIDAKEGFFFQDYVPGQREFTTHSISVLGKLVFVATNMHIYKEAFYVKGRHTPLGIFDLGDGAPKEIEGILRLLNYTGCACFNYKMDGNRPLIFEMNPRVGASFYRVANRYLAGYARAIHLMNSGAPFSVQKADEINPKALKRLVAASIRESVFNGAIFRKSRRLFRSGNMKTVLRLLVRNNDAYKPTQPK
jgi:hypothetical protein